MADGIEDPPVFVEYLYPVAGVPLENGHTGGCNQLT